MKSITVRGIEPELAAGLRRLAKQEGKSVNQLVLDTLRQRLGMLRKKKFTEVHHDMDHLFGRWSEDDYRRIVKKIDSGRKIDKELWK